METLEFQLGLYAAIFTHALLALPFICAVLLIPSAAIREHTPVRNRRRFSLRRFASYKKIGGI